MTRNRCAPKRPPTVSHSAQFRPLVAGWKFFSSGKGGFQAEFPPQSEEWNRGAYLVEGVGHCGACHKPRNFLGAKRTQRFLAGGEPEVFDAAGVNSLSPAPVQWSADHVFKHIRHGFRRHNGVPAGPHGRGLLSSQTVTHRA